MSKKAIVDFIPVVSSNSAAYTNFIARTSGLDSTHLNAYAGLLNGLTTDGIFNSDGTSSYLDILYCYATQGATTAQLNLVSSSFNGTATGLTFTADQGYKGWGTTTSNYFNTNFNPSTAGGKYTQNSASMGVWCYDTPTASKRMWGSITGSGQNIYPYYSGLGCFLRLNDLIEATNMSTSQLAGFYLANRSSSTARQGYQNGTSVGTYGSITSQAINNSNLASGMTDAGWTSTLSGMMAGGSLNSTLQSNLYSRLRTYMTAVGVP